MFHNVSFKTFFNTQVMEIQLLKVKETVFVKLETKTDAPSFHDNPLMENFIMRKFLYVMYLYICDCLLTLLEK